MPVYRGGELVLIQGRRLNKFDKGPKYLTWKKDSAIWMPVPGRSPTLEDTLVLVEDILSAIRVGRQQDCLAILGTNLPDHVLTEVAPLYDRFIVWLDNDNLQVKEQQLKLKRKLELFGPADIVRESGKQDAKLLTDEEINKVLTKY